MLRIENGNVDAVNITPGLKSAALNHFAQLEEPGRGGLTPLHVIEAAAFHYQVSANWTSAGTRYPTAIYPLDPLYQAAYDVAKRTLGDKTFFFLPLLANHALCHEHPGSAFTDFANALAAYMGKDDGNIPWSIFDDTSEQPLGQARHIEENFGCHPIYSRVVGILDRRIDQKLLFESPHAAINPEIADSIAPLVILNRIQGSKRAIWAPSWMRDVTEIEKMTLLFHRSGMVYQALQNS